MTASNGWPTERIGEILDVKYGKALPKRSRRGGHVPVYGSNGIVGWHDVALTKGPTIIIGRKGSSGAVNYSPVACWPIDTTYFIDDPGPFLIEFLEHVLRSLGLTEMDRSTAIPGLNRGELYELEIPVPPQPAQVEVLRGLYHIAARQSDANSHLSAARNADSRFQQSVLAAACAGRLTADWRAANPVTEPAAKLVGRIASARQARLGRRLKPTPEPRTDAPLPEGWCWTTIGALVDVATGATPLRSRQEYYGGSIPWVTSGAVNAGVITQATEFITELALRETNVKLFRPGTLVIAMYGEGQTRGRVAELGIEATTNQALAALLFNEDSAALRPYLRLFLLDNYERIRRLSFGGVQPNLSLTLVRETELPLPPLPEQEEIVRRVDDIMQRSNQLRSRISSAAAVLEKSRRVVLRRALAGELR